MKLLMINYMALPIPAVCGGAVEYLIEAFLKDNENEHRHDISVYSIFNEKAVSEAEKYKYTKFKYIKIKGFADKIERIIRHIINKYTRLYIGNTYIKKVLNAEKNLDRFDAVIVENTPEFGSVVRKKYKGRLILHLHNDYLNVKSKNAKKIFDCYDEIYTISNKLGKNVQTIQKSDKVKTLYNGIDLNKFSPSAEIKHEMRKKYNIKGSDFVFLFCGRVVPDKGVLPLVKAFSKIKNDNIKLVIAGGTGYNQFEETSYLQKIRAFADERVIFTGFIPYEEMNKVYNMADVGVIPSIFNDPFNLTTIEFCSNGIPVVISDRGAMHELVNDECSVVAKCDADFAENIESALRYMLKKKSEMDSMKNEAKKTAKKFSIENYCSRFNKLLMELEEYCE